MFAPSTQLKKAETSAGVGSAVAAAAASPASISHRSEQKQPVWVRTSVAHAHQSHGQRFDASQGGEANEARVWTVARYHAVRMACWMAPTDTKSAHCAMYDSGGPGLPWNMIYVWLKCRYDVDDEHVDECVVQDSAESFLRRLDERLRMGTYFAVIDADRCAWGYFPETIVRVVVRELPLEPAPPQEA